MPIISLAILVEIYIQGLARLELRIQWPAKQTKDLF